MTDYTVHAKRAGRYWELHIDDVGVTQARNLGTDADEMIRSYITMTTGAEADSISYPLVPEVGAGLDAEAAEARKAAREAEEAVNVAAARNRAAARRLQAAGLTGRDTAVVLGVTPQRVSQLLSPPTASSRSRKRSRAGEKQAH